MNKVFLFLFFFLLLERDVEGWQVLGEVTRSAVERRRRLGGQGENANLYYTTRLSSFGNNGFPANNH